MKYLIMITMGSRVFCRVGCWIDDSGSVSASGAVCLAESAGCGQFDPEAVTCFSPGTKGAWSIHI